MSKTRNLANSAPQFNSLIVPTGNTTQRPAVTAGQIRFNTDLNTLESANGSAWSNVGSGGTSSGGYSANTTDTGYLAIPIGTLAQRPYNPPFGAMRWNTSNTQMEVYIGNNSWQGVAYSIYSAQVLTVAGGGAGGGQEGGGGGAGGLLYTSNTSLIPGSSYAVVVRVCCKAAAHESPGPSLPFA